MALSIHGCHSRDSRDDAHLAAASTFALSAAMTPGCAGRPQATSQCPCLQNVAVDLHSGSQLVLGGSTRVFRLRGSGLHAGQKRTATAELATDVCAKQGRTEDAPEGPQSGRDTGQQGMTEPEAAPSQGQFANLIRQEVRPRSSSTGGAIKGHVSEKTGQQGSRNVHRFVEQQMKRRTSDLYDALPPERQATT